MKDFLLSVLFIGAVLCALLGCVLLACYDASPNPSPDSAALFSYSIQAHPQQIADGLAAGYEIRYIDGYRVVLQKPKVGKMTEVVPVKKAKK